MNTVLLSDESRQELTDLMFDPIIILMSESLPPNVDFQAWDFISQASKFYTRMGGTQAKSIGGPARAIEQLRK